MNFYTIDYITRNQTDDRKMLYILMVVAGLAMVIFVLLYLRDKMATKYRDLGIIALLFLLLFAGVQYEKVLQTNSQKSQTSQLVPFMKSVATDKGVSPKKVLVNSTTLQNGLIVRIDNKDYQLNLNPDNNSYTLTQAHIIDHHVYINK